METRANHVWVGAVTLVLLAALAAFIVWIARLGRRRDRKEYDIFFQQSVDGLAKGSQVTFAGVPVGKVDEIELWEKDPQFVRVRISGQGRRADPAWAPPRPMQGSFTGVSTIQLDGARAGAAADHLQDRGPRRRAGDPAQGRRLGAILASAPLLLERLATLTERLTDLLDDDNQRSIAGILANTDRHDRAARRRLAAGSKPVLDGPRCHAGAGDTTRWRNSSRRWPTNELLNKRGRAARHAGTARDAGLGAQAADALSATHERRAPGRAQMSESTLPAAEAALRDLRKTSACAAPGDRIDRRPAAPAA